ncbi:hypothetical protein HYU13_00860 [Candidatus Woesearchaeota archaeon]|nr:hypothetical protein [Candidatus Woesearchaeota archaeon]
MPILKVKDDVFLNLTANIINLEVVKLETFINRNSFPRPMDKSRRDMLERKLAAIKEIKQEEYVGTGNALARLGESPRYPATRERVLGVCDKVEGIYEGIASRFEDILRASPENDDDGDDGRDDDSGNLDNEDDYSQIQSMSERYVDYLDANGQFTFRGANPIVNWRAFLIGDFQKKVPDRKSLAEHLSKIFIITNDLDEPFDNKLGYIAVIHVIWQGDVPKDIYTLAEIASRNVNWASVFSEGGVRKVESSIKSSLRADYFCPQGQFQVMDYCHELGNHENRRKLLTSKLETDGVVSPDGLEGVREEWKICLECAAQRRDDLITIRGPEVIIKSTDTRIKYLEFLLRTLRQEEGYIRGFLGA